jgi:hypothetical protein
MARGLLVHPRHLPYGVVAAIAGLAGTAGTARPSPEKVL